jgi:hypothetical protein
MYGMVRGMAWSGVWHGQGCIYLQSTGLSVYATLAMPYMKELVLNGTILAERVEMLVCSGPNGLPVPPANGNRASNDRCKC